MVPVVLGGALIVADLVKSVVVGEAEKNWTDLIRNIGDIKHTQFMENFRSKELTLMISRNYTTDTKNLTGSILPEIPNGNRIEQIERLIQATLNQSKFR